MVHVFIVNPKCSPEGYSVWLRKELSDIPDLNYYVLTSREAGYETELVRILERTFEGEQLRFYSCGGSGTARNILAGFDDMDREELAIIPLGRVDYLKVYDDPEAFKDIHAMIEGDVVHVDYFKTNHGPSLNCVSMGLDTFALKAGENLKGFRAFGKGIPSILANLYSLWFAPNYPYDIHVNGQHLTERFAQISFCNVPYLGGNLPISDDKNITDGFATVFICPAINVAKKLRLKKYMQKYGDVTKSGDRGLMLMSATSMKIRRRNGAHFWVDLDGELVFGVDWQIDVVQQGLRLVVPRRISDGKR